MLNPFRHLFLPRRYLQTRTDVVPPSGKAGRKQWVVARSLCFYRLFVLGDVPSSERRGALGMRISEWSPFPETGRYVVWRDERAMVWVWDEEERRRKAQAANMSGTGVVPEPLLRDCPRDDGLRVVKCIDGIEVQLWKGDVLTTSRWWADVPQRESWSRFLLALDRNPLDPFPDAVELPWLDRPWGGGSQSGFVLNPQHEKRYVLPAFAIFALFLIWNGTGIAKWHGAIAELEERSRSLGHEVEPILKARSCALDYRQKAEAFLSLASYPSQMELMASVAGKFPTKEVTFVEWHYSKGHLAFGLQGENLDPSYFVSACQEFSFFSDVIAERGQKPDRLDVKLVVKQKGR